MSIGMAMLALLLVCGAVLGIIVIAGAPHPTYTDSFGNTPTNQTNATQGVLTNSTAPLTSAAGGLAILFGFFIIIIAGVFLSGALGGKNYGQKR